MKNVGNSHVFIPSTGGFEKSFSISCFLKFGTGRGVHHGGIQRDTEEYGVHHGGTQRDTRGSEKHRFQRGVRKEYVTMKI